MILACGEGEGIGSEHELKARALAVESSESLGSPLELLSKLESTSSHKMDRRRRRFFGILPEEVSTPAATSEQVCALLVRIRLVPARRVVRDLLPELLCRGRFVLMEGGGVNS